MNTAEHQLDAVDEVPASDGSANLRVLIADDHPLLLAGLRRVLESQDDIEVVGQARSGPEVVALVERRRPGIVLMDLRMPGSEGFGLIAQLRERWPDVKLVILSASDDKASVDGALHAGARAFIVKSTAPTDVAAVLRQVSSGAIYHAPTANAQPGSGEQRSAAPEGPALTDREQQILAAVAHGSTTAVISRELWVSEHTVKFHLTNIYRKLGVPNRSAAVRYALEHGLVA